MYDSNPRLHFRATPNRVTSHSTDDAASRASTGINGEPDEETLDLRDEVLSTSMFEEIVGSSEAICAVSAQLLRVAPSDATVLITGDTVVLILLLELSEHGRVTLLARHLPPQSDPLTGGHCHIAAWAYWFAEATLDAL